MHKNGYRFLKKDVFIYKKSCKKGVICYFDPSKKTRYF